MICSSENFARVASPACGSSVRSLRGRTLARMAKRREEVTLTGQFRDRVAKLWGHLAEQSCNPP